MPRLEPKIVQKELEAGKIWPVYWLFGTERMKSRELLRRIRKSVVGEGLGFNEEILEGGEVGATEIVEAAQSMSLGGGVRFMVIRDAHLIKEAEDLEELLGPPVKLEELTHCCIFLSKDLDGRRKFSKTLTEKAAVVPCEEVPEEEREGWIGYLSKRRGVNLPQELVARLRGLDPWTLDSVDSELEKYSLALSVDPEAAAQVVLGGAIGEYSADLFLDAFFRRDLKKTLEIVTHFADAPDESLPLLGLFSWNVRSLAGVVADRERGTRYAKLNPYLASRFESWARRWTLEEVADLQSGLAELDFGMKQTPKLGIGLWSELVARFCR